MKEYIKNIICSAVEEMDLSTLHSKCNKALDKMITEIQGVLKNDDFDDFECVERLIAILESNGYECGNRHDF